MALPRLESRTHRGRLRPEIALSWKRVRMAGLDPETAIKSLRGANVDPQSQLMVAAAPVLEDLESKLAGTYYCIILADRQCRIVHRWFDDRRVERVLDEVGARPGATFLEESVGTNALGTAFELRKGMVVHGEEHFVEPFKRFSCYGHPIRHPLTKRVEGVLDITGMVSMANPLLAPFIARAVQEIEQRLVDGTRTSERHLLAAFQAASTKRQTALAAIGEDMVLANRAALDLLQPCDYATMRMLMSDLRDGVDTAVRMALSSGEDVTIGATRVAGARPGAIFRIDPAVAKEPSGSVGASPAPGSPVGGLPVLVSGARGTGRTTTAGDLAQVKPMVFLNSATALLEGEAAWAREYQALMMAKTGTLCIEGIELLSDPLLSLVIDGVSRTGRPNLIFTSGPRDCLKGLSRTLASMCVQRVDLKDLRERGSEIHQLASRMLRESTPESRARLTPSVLEVLAAQSWPGNLHELRAVMTHVSQRRTAGDVTLAELPDTYRFACPEKPLPGLARAERDAIVRALADCDGNKVKAARQLGISRTTLYARMRALRIWM